MKTDLYLYERCRISKDKNYILDDIEKYLYNLPKLIINDFQFVKIDNNINLKVSYNGFKESYINNFPYGYVKIVEDGVNYYFFIDDVRWKSEKCFELNLTLDVLNTFKTYFEFGEKTHVIREHKDRFYNPGDISKTTLKRKIDRFSEDFGVLPKYRVYDAIVNNINTPNPETEVWNLIYVTIDGRLRVLLAPTHNELIFYDERDLPPEPHTINTIDHIKLYDVNINKIIVCPYCPVKFESYLDGWKLTNPPSEFTSYIGYDGGLYIVLSYSGEFVGGSDLERIEITELNKTINRGNENGIYDFRNIENESKLYNSDYYELKINYDSYNKGVNLESVKNEVIPYDKIYLDVEYIKGKDLNTSGFFGVKLNGTRLDYSIYHTVNDYENVLLFNRNNDKTLYNSEYLNYLKYGYTYDKKDINQRNYMNWITSGLQIAGGVAGLAASSVTGGVSAAAGISLITSGVTSFSNNISNQISSERSLDKKLTELQNQSVNVISGDDLSSLGYYNGNKLHLMKYNVSDIMRNMLGMYFHLYGYKTNEYKVPDVKSRIRFNFLQCDAHFVNDDEGIFIKYGEKIKNLFNEGVTYLHSVYGYYDFEQEYENYENWMFEGDYNE